MPKQIIALCSLKETGKSTLARHVLSLMKGSWTFLGETKLNVLSQTNLDVGIIDAPFSFADNIKSSLAPTLRAAVDYEIAFCPTSKFKGYEKCSPGILYDLLYGALKNYPLKALGDKTPRYLMQQYGTEFIRSINNKFWADVTFAKIYSLMATQKKRNNCIAVIDDMREIAELQTIKDMCKKHNIVFTPIALEREDVVLSDTHSSETNAVITSKFIKDNYPDNVIKLMKSDNPNQMDDPNTFANIGALRMCIMRDRGKKPIKVDLRTVIQDYKYQEKLNQD